MKIMNFTLSVIDVVESIRKIWRHNLLMEKMMPTARSLAKHKSSDQSCLL